MKKFLATAVLAYFRCFARMRIHRFNPLIIGITGSAGKTSTCDAVATVLPDTARLKKSGKANSESGIPLNILDLYPHDYSLLDWLRLIVLAPVHAFSSTHPFNIYIAEMGIDSPYPPKNMDYLLSIIHPQIGIFLNALPVHAAAFDAVVTSNLDDRTQKIIDAIATEKAKLIQQLPSSGVGIVNADNEAVMTHLKNVSAKIMTFGKTSTADLIIVSIFRSLDSTSIHYVYQSQEATLKLPYALPDHFAYSFAAALLVGISQKQSLVDGCIRIEKKFRLPPGRASILTGINDSVIIDSSYNASGQPMIDMISLLGSLPAHRHLALLGDMRELGKETQKEHERVLNTALSECDVVVLVGPLMKKFGIPYAQTQGKLVHWFASSREAGMFLRQELLQGDVLLVKGSQNTLYMEIAVEMLLKNADDTHQLCRRGDYWDRMRQTIK
jgi:UDP-N-acetylmuramoyl-tripeptide--D-alanyl-D-alanine ligase